MKKEYDFSKGRRGPVIKPKRKTRITIYLDDDVIEAFRVKGDDASCGYQTLINSALREYLSKDNRQVDTEILRKIFREELTRSLHKDPGAWQSRDA